MPDAADNVAYPPPTLGSWSVQATWLSLHDRYITVRSETLRAPDGRLVTPFHILDYSPWVTTFALTRDLQVLLVEQYRHGIGAWTQEFPAGAAEPGDGDMQAAAVREVAEETSFGAGRWYDLGSTPVNASTHSNRVHFWLAVDLVSVALDKQEGEDVSVRAVPLQRFARALREGTFEPPALHMALLQRLASRLPALLTAYDDHAVRAVAAALPG